MKHVKIKDLEIGNVFLHENAEGSIMIVKLEEFIPPNGFKFDNGATFILTPETNVLLIGNSPTDIIFHNQAKIVVKEY